MLHLKKIPLPLLLVLLNRLNCMVELLLVDNYCLEELFLHWKPVDLANYQLELLSCLPGQMFVNFAPLVGKDLYF